MKVLVVGGGGREHAIIMKLAESPKIDKLYCTPGNGGISKYAQCFSVKATDIEGVVEIAKELAVDMVVVAPDDPLVLGMVDALEAEGIKAFGPNKAAAAIEGSKVFSKDLMKKYDIPTAKYEVFSDSVKAIEYLKNENKYPAVIKADGLALGKGVIIAQNFEEAKNAVISIMEDQIFGKSGANIVIEEFLNGPEVSVLCFTDGKTISPMVSSMDHKRALDNDEGLNTGGMGTVAPNPYYTQEIADTCMETIFIPTIKAMSNENRTFKGCLYFGLMITENGPKVIEYNCRFGDPETQVVLPLLDTDLIDIFNAVINETLNDLNIQWKNQSAACIIMASGGYPKKYETGLEISGLDEKGQISDSMIFHAGTQIKDEKFYTSGGRVLGVTALSDQLRSALDLAYSSVSKIYFDKVHYRKDIGQRALNSKKLQEELVCY